MARCNMLFGSCAAQLQAPVFANYESVCVCQIWSLPTGPHMFNLLWREPHRLVPYYQNSLPTTLISTYVLCLWCPQQTSILANETEWNE